jgi:hypothetical protein
MTAAYKTEWMADDPISKTIMIIKLKSILKMSFIQSSIIKIIAAHPIIPIDKMTKEAFIMTLASSNFFSAKLFPKKR